MISMVLWSKQNKTYAKHKQYWFALCFQLPSLQILWFATKWTHTGNVYIWLELTINFHQGMPFTNCSYHSFFVCFVFKPLKAWFCCQNFEANNCIMRLNAQSTSKIVFKNWNHHHFSWTKSTSVLIPWSFRSAAVPELPKTISLISHPSKVMLKIMLNRLKPQAEKIITEEQAGFRAGRSTTKQGPFVWRVNNFKGG